MKKIILLMIIIISGVACALEQQDCITENGTQEIVIQNGSTVLQDNMIIENESVDGAVKEQSETNKKETTFAIIKPDGVNSGYTGPIIDLIEKNGFEIVRMYKKILSKKDAESFYAAHKEKPFFNDLVLYMTSGPIVILQLSKENAIADWRALIGATDPANAAMGTIRKMYGVSKTYNAVHGSDSKEAALQEIMIMFND